MHHAESREIHYDTANASWTFKVKRSQEMGHRQSAESLDVILATKDAQRQKHVYNTT